MSFVRSRAASRDVRHVFAALLAAALLLLSLAWPVAAVEGPTKLFDVEVSPRSGSTATVITFAVTYRNREGSPPAFVRVAIDGVAHDMTGSGGTEWKGGVTHTFSTRLPVGVHAVTFEATDSRRFSDSAEGGTVTITQPTPTPPPPPAPTPAPTLTPPPTPAPTVTPRPTQAPTPTPTPNATTPATPAPTSSGSAQFTPTPAAGGPSGSAEPDPSDPGGFPTGGATGGSDEGAPDLNPSPSDAPPGSGAAVPPGVGPSGSGEGSGGSGGRAGGPSGAGGPAAFVAGWGDLAAALGALGIDGPSPFPGVIPTLVGTTGAVAMAMSFAIFGKKRRDAEQPGPDEVLHSRAARGVGEGPTTELTRAVVAQSAMPVPPDLEADMPRWRRPSLMQARRADPVRDAAGTMPRLRFDDGIVGAVEGREVRTIRYRIVSLLDAPDELRSAEIGQLDQGDEVQLIEKSGAYWLVLCPDGRQGWLHKMTLGEVVSDRADDAAHEAWDSAEASEELLAAYLAARAQA